MTVLENIAGATGLSERIGDSEVIHLSDGPLR